MIIKRCAFAVASCWLLTGCGLLVPEKQELFQDRIDQRLNENDLVNRIKCELHKGIQDTLAAYSPKGRHAGNSVEWLRRWAAKVSFEITVEEKGGLGPGVSVAKTFADSTMLTLGFGLSGSGDVTRDENISFTYLIKDLLAEGYIRECDLATGILITSDLKIDQFIEDKAFLAKVPATVFGPGGRRKYDPDVQGPFDVFTYSVTFVVSYGFSATPSWKLTQVSVNPSGTFASASRQRTHKITITLGKAEDPAVAKLNAEAEAEHNAKLIGQAVANAIRSQQQQ